MNGPGIELESCDFLEPGYISCPSNSMKKLVWFAATMKSTNTSRGDGWVIIEDIPKVRVQGGIATSRVKVQT